MICKRSSIECCSSHIVILDYHRLNSRSTRIKDRPIACNARSIQARFVNLFLLRILSRWPIWDRRRSKRISSITWNWSRKNVDVFSCRWFVYLSIHFVINSAYTSDLSVDTRVTLSRIIRVHERSRLDNVRQHWILAVSRNEDVRWMNQCLLI